MHIKREQPHVLFARNRRYHCFVKFVFGGRQKVCKNASISFSQTKLMQRGIIDFLLKTF